MNTVNNTTKITLTATQSMDFLAVQAKKSRLWGKDRPAGAFGEPGFNVWLLAAMTQAYVTRLPKDYTATGECPYQMAKAAVGKLSRSYLQSVFDGAVDARVSDKDVRAMIIAGVNAANDGDKEWLCEALDALQAARDKLHVIYSGLSMALFRHSGKNVFSLTTPDIYFKMVVSLDGVVDSEDSERAMCHKEEIDAYEVITRRGWKILKDELLKPVVKAFELADDTKITAAWFKVTELVARGRSAYGDVVRELVHDGDNRFEIIVNGWESNRIRFLTDVVNDPNGYAGDPRDYAGQLANATKWAGRYELCESLYEEFGDMVRELYKALPESEDYPERINSDSVRLSTRVAGLWGNPVPGKKGVTYFNEIFSNMESAIAGAKEARIHEQIAYNRENVHNVEDAALVVAAKLGWL